MSTKVGFGLGAAILFAASGAAAYAAVTSEPGESNYSPLWSETILSWKAGAKPTLITSDTQIDKVEKAGKLTEHDANVVLNCPIVKVGKG